MAFPPPDVFECMLDEKLEGFKARERRIIYSLLALDSLILDLVLFDELFFVMALLYFVIALLAG